MSARTARSPKLEFEAGQDDPTIERPGRRCGAPCVDQGWADRPRHDDHDEPDPFRTLLSDRVRRACCARGLLRQPSSTRTWATAEVSWGSAASTSNLLDHRGATPSTGLLNRKTFDEKRTSA